LAFFDVMALFALNCSSLDQALEQFPSIIVSIRFREHNADPRDHNNFRSDKSFPDLRYNQAMQLE
jgi:hypothetical protein